VSAFAHTSFQSEPRPAETCFRNILPTLTPAYGLVPSPSCHLSLLAQLAWFGKWLHIRALRGTLKYLNPARSLIHTCLPGMAGVNGD